MVTSSVDSLRGGDGVLRGLACFDLERMNIEAGHAWAAEQADSDEAAAELCITYPDAGAPNERIHLLKAMLTAARRLNQRNAEGWALGNLGNAYAALRETQRVIEFYEQALEIEN